MADGGRRVQLHRLDPDTCAVVESRTAKVDPYDAEDLAGGPDGSLWVGDTGDNDQRRSTVALIVVPPRGEPVLHRLTYPDGPHDAEALLVDARGMPTVVTKSPGCWPASTSPKGRCDGEGPTPLVHVADLALPTSTTQGGPVGGFGTRTVTGGRSARTGAWSRCAPTPTPGCSPSRTAAASRTRCAAPPCRSRCPASRRARRWRSPRTARCCPAPRGVAGSPGRSAAFPGPPGSSPRRPRPYPLRNPAADLRSRRRGARAGVAHGGDRRRRAGGDSRPPGARDGSARRPPGLGSGRPAGRCRCRSSRDSRTRRPATTRSFSAPNWRA